MSESTVGDWVLDPAGSSVEILGKSFWGVVPVRGKFGTVSGAGTMAADGSITGSLVIDAASVNTKNDQRDKHLRSAEFFNVEKHPNITVNLNSGRRDGSSLAAEGSVEAAGVTVPVTFTANVQEGTDAVVLRAKLPMSRGKFGMTWQPMPGMVKDIIQVTVAAKFVRP